MKRIPSSVKTENIIDKPKNPNAQKRMQSFIDVCVHECICKYSCINEYIFHLENSVLRL